MKNLSFENQRVSFIDRKLSPLKFPNSIEMKISSDWESQMRIECIAKAQPKSSLLSAQFEILLGTSTNPRESSLGIIYEFGFTKI